jgi:hypothetical protein
LSRRTGRNLMTRDGTWWTANRASTNRSAVGRKG